MRPKLFGSALVAMLGASATAWACLDVGVPPGLPFEWEKPARPITQSLRMPKRAAPNPGNATRERRKRFASESRPKVYTERTTAMGYARVTTVDILNHLRWTGGPAPDALELPLARTRPRTGAATGARTRGPYPPRISVGLYWVNFAIYLRMLLHPNQVSDFESLERLVETGFPALTVLNDLSKQAFVKSNHVAQARLRRWLAVLTKRVGPLPRRPPRAIASKDPRQAMLLRLVADDLAAGYASSLDPFFAARILALPNEEAVPLLIRYTERGVHPLLRRNAVALLASYKSKQVTACLERVIKAGDAVCRLRAFFALARQGSSEAQRAAFASAKKVGSRTSVHVLGLTRSDKMLKPALKLLRRGPDDRMLGIRALGRLKTPDKKAIKALKKALKRIRGMKPGTWFEQPAMLADVPDTRDMRRLAVFQLGIVALARLGSEQHKKQLFKLLAQAPPEKDGQGRILRRSRDPVASQGTFGVFLVPTIAYLLESLEFMGDRARPRLVTVVQDKVCDVSLRLAALRVLDRIGADTKPLIKALVEDPKPAVRAQALTRLLAIDRNDALRRARRILEAGGKRSGQEAIAAAEVFGAVKAGDMWQKGTLKLKTVLRATPGGKALHTFTTAGSIELYEQQGTWYRVKTITVAKRPGREGWVPVKAVTFTKQTPHEVLITTLAAEQAKASKKPNKKPAGPPLGLGVANNPVITIAFPVAEAVARALSRFPSPDGIKALLAFLRDSKQRSSTRGAVAAALGATGRGHALRGLVLALDDADGWVRYCAYRALRHTAEADGVDATCDWIYGAKTARAGAVEVFRAWAGKKP